MCSLFVRVPSLVQLARVRQHVADGIDEEPIIIDFHDLLPRIFDDCVGYFNQMERV